MQTAIVIAIIAICAGFVLRRALRSLAGTKTGCGCATCPALKDKPRLKPQLKPSSPIAVAPRVSGGHPTP